MAGGGLGTNGQGLVVVAIPPHHPGLGRENGVDLIVIASDRPGMADPFGGWQHGYEVVRHAHCAVM